MATTKRRKTVRGAARRKTTSSARLAPRTTARRSDLRAPTKPPPPLALKGLLEIVCLLPDTGWDIGTLVLSRKRRDRVAWKNHDTVARKVSFTGTCPLAGFPTAGVTLPPLGAAGPWTVKPDATIRTYGYKISPPYTRYGTPPGEPQIDIGE